MENLTGFNLLWGGDFEPENLFSSGSSILQRTVYPIGGSNLQIAPFITNGNELMSLIEQLIHQTPTLSSCLKRAAMYTHGDGYIIKEKYQNELLPKPLEFFTKSIQAQRHEVPFKIVMDLLGYGNCWLLLKKKGDLIKIEHIPFTKALYAVDTEGVPKQVAIHSDYRNAQIIRVNTGTIDFYDIFDVEDINSNDFDRGCVVHLRTPDGSDDYYGLPYWYGAVRNVMTEMELNRFEYNAVKDGYAGGTFFELYGLQLDPKDFASEMEQLRKQYAGNKHPGKIIARMGVSKDLETKAITLPNVIPPSSDRYQIAQDAIVMACMLTPATAAINRPGQMGSYQQFPSELQSFYATFAAMIQSNIMEGLINPVLVANGFEEYIEIQSNIPMLAMGYVDLNTLVSVDEGREAIGLTRRGDDRLINEAQRSANENDLQDQGNN